MENEDITVSVDVCNYYINKLHEITDEINVSKNTLFEAREITENNWSGESGTATLEAIGKLIDRLKSVDSSLSDAMTLIFGLSVSEE